MSTDTTRRQPARARTRFLPPADSPWLPRIAAATTLLLWASAFVAIRHLGHTVAPGPLTLGRLLVASLALAAMLLTRPSRRWPRRRDLPLLLACGISWFGVYNLAVNASERRVDAGTTALLVQVGPILVSLFAAVFLGERITRWLLIGMTIGFAGVVVIAEGSSESSNGDPVGVLLGVVAATTYAIGVLTQKPLMRRLGPMEVTFLSCLIGAATALPFAGALVDLLRTAPTSSLVLLVYLGVFPTAVAFSTWAFALSHTDAGKLSLTTFLVPGLTTLLAWGLLDEVPPALAFLGGAMCIGGVLLTRRRSRRREPGAPVG